MQTSEKPFSITKRAQYHETDGMRIVHHANYVKWMEEARLEFFRSVGFVWSRMEEEAGIMIPVLFQSVEYKTAIQFDEEIIVTCVCERFNGVKISFSYEFLSKDGMLHAKGTTKHGFINKSFEAVMLQDAFEAGYKALNKAVNG